MNLKSIRWRLPLSYAGIAFLAALALGSVMLLVLNGYYTRQERAYLQGNAQALQPMMENALKADIPLVDLQDTINSLAFLSQTRIRILDEQGNPIVDTGIPDPNQVVALSGAQAETVIVNMPGDAFVQTSAGEIQGGQVVTNLSPGMVVAAGTEPAGVYTFVSVSASPYGYAFTNVPSSTSSRRSSQKVELALSGSLGTLEISDGPAYGRDIIRSVSLAWAGAGMVAILLAALAGWFASRQVIHPVLALTDVTQRMEGGNLSVRVNLPGKRPAAEFQALAHSFNGMAQRVDDTVSTLRAFVADAAHELHTPLTALHTNLELAADEGDARHRTLYLERAQEQSVRLEALVNGLLNLSRIEAGRFESETESVDLNRLLGEVGEQFASRAEQAERAFSIELPGETICVNGDPAQLRQVINNLLENSLKFTPAGGLISLNLNCSAGEANLAVTDTGIGIPTEDLPHLFERFHRGRNASSYPGSGLGLAITRALVLAHGGSIRAESEPGKGTKISICLPVSQT